MNYIAGIRDDNYERIFSEHDPLKEVSIFSDSIIISYPGSLSIGGAFFHVLLDLVHICIELLGQKMYIRGGVTYGRMYHDKKVCFGPAMIRAYNLEKDVAIYPRVVIDAETIKRGQELPGLGNSDETETKEIQELICKDTGGTDLYYLDFLSQYQEFDDCDSYINFLEYTKEDLCNHLSKDYKKDILEKYKWFSGYYNNTVKKIFGENSPIEFINLNE